MIFNWTVLWREGHGRQCQPLPTSHQIAMLKPMNIWNFFFNLAASCGCALWHTYFHFGSKENVTFYIIPQPNHCFHGIEKMEKLWISFWTFQGWKSLGICIGGWFSQGWENVKIGWVTHPLSRFPCYQENLKSLTFFTLLFQVWNDQELWRQNLDLSNIYDLNLFLEIQIPFHVLASSDKLWCNPSF